MLQEFQLQRHREAKTQLRGGDAKDGRVPDMVRDPRGGGGDIVSADHGGDAGTLRREATRRASFPARTGPQWAVMQIHGSCASRAGDGVLLIGPPGAGKSDLLLRLLARGFDLVADDRVDIVDGIARPVARSGRPARGSRPRHRAPAACRLGQACALRSTLAASAARMPAPTRHDAFDLPLVTIDPQAASAPERVALALDCALRRVTQVAGAFAA